MPTDAWEQLKMLLLVSTLTQTVFVNACWSVGAGHDCELNGYMHAHLLAYIVSVKYA